ncbi:phosphoribosylaminoimidazolesuccinocarboxamide synthase [Guggenheimella bovis]
MKLIYQGKTKNVYALDNGNIMLKFKDDVTGKDGVFDPGENQVGLSIEGSGNAALRLTRFFFEKCKENGIYTHYVDSNVDQNEMEVIPVKPFGQGLEFVCRYKAVGSFLRRFKKYVTEGEPLDALVEITIKDDAAGDPPMTREILTMLKIVTDSEYDELVKMTREISNLVKDELAKKGLELYDIKLEFGRDLNGKVVLIDEISGGNMRVYRGTEYIQPLDLPGLLLD